MFATGNSNFNDVLINWGAGFVWLAIFCIVGYIVLSYIRLESKKADIENNKSEKLRMQELKNEQMRGRVRIAEAKVEAKRI